MKYRALVVFPLVFAAAFVALDRVFAGGPEYRTFMRVEVEIVKSLALIGSLVAALRFRPADYLFRAWIFTGLCLLLLLTRDASLLLQVGPEVQAVIVTLANVSAVVGAFFLARAWRVAGLERNDGQGWRLVVICTITVAAALTLPGIYFEFTSVRSGNLADVALVVSSLADLAALILIAPILYTALALRGGLLGWPWGLFVSSMLAWLVYDNLSSLGPHLGLPPELNHTLAETFRGLACTLTMSAGLAQRWVVDDARASK